MNNVNMLTMAGVNDEILISGENLLERVVLTEEVINKLRRLAPQVCKMLVDNWQYFIANMDSDFLYHGHVGIYTMVIDENFLIGNALYCLSAIIPSSKPAMGSKIALIMQKAKIVNYGKIAFNPYNSWWTSRDCLPNLKEGEGLFITFHDLDQKSLFPFTVNEEFKEHDILQFTKQLVVSVYKKISCNEQFSQELSLGDLQIVPEDTEAFVCKIENEYIDLLCRYYDVETNQYQKLYMTQRREDIGLFCCFSMVLNELQRRYLLGLDDEEKYKFFVNALSLDCLDV